MNLILVITMPFGGYTERVLLSDLSGLTAAVESADFKGRIRLKTDSATNATIAYSLISSCKAVGIDPRTWMEDVLKRLPEYEYENGDLSELLPGNWRQNTDTGR